MFSFLLFLCFSSSSVIVFVCYVHLLLLFGRALHRRDVQFSHEKEESTTETEGKEKTRITGRCLFYDCHFYSVVDLDSLDEDAKREFLIQQRKVGFLRACFRNK
jgi:hypothetical protein